jgi:hypothetical protein
MATGILGQSAPAANTDTTVYTVPGAITATFNISVVNIGSASAAVTIALASAATPTASEYIEFQTVLAPGQVLERGGLVMQATERVVVNCSTANCSVSVFGYEA